MRKKILVLVLCFMSIFTGIKTASADWRSYVWTYEYMTMRKGTAEVEYYMTTEIPDLDITNINTWKHWLELEYGITDHLDVAMYQQFKQTNIPDKSKFEYDGFKIRTRYRFGEKGQFLLDPLVYLEWIRNDDFSKPNVLEGKLILAKNIFKFNIAYNQIIKQELESGGKTEHEYAAGINYELLHNLKLGIESKGNYTAAKYYLGPTISWAESGHKFWVSFGTVFGLNNKSDDFQSRLLVGIPF